MSCFAGKWYNKVLLFNIKASSSSFKHYSPRLFNIPQHHRSYSTSGSPVAPTQPIKVYINADTDKLQILKENMG